MKTMVFDKLCSSDRLELELHNNALIRIDRVNITTQDSPPKTTINFKDDITVDEQQAVTDIVDAHVNEPLPEHVVQKVDLDVPKDIEGAQMIRTKTTKCGWMMGLKTFSFSTAKWLSMFGWLDDTTLQDAACVLKFYDADNVQITDEANMSQCVRTMASWEPLYDYDIMGAMIEVIEDPTGDFRLVSVAVPDLPKAYGGSKVNIEGGYNLRYLRGGRVLNLDGNTCKAMFYSATYHTNKVSMNVYHDAGAQLGVQVSVIIFRG